MTKNTLLLFAVVTTLVTMGAGCAKQVATDQTNVTTEQRATFLIKELGITLDLPAYKDDLAYQIKPGTSERMVAAMYSKSAMEKDPNCGPGSIGYISKRAQLYTIEGSNTRAPVAGVDIKIGDAYISIEGPQDMCTTDKDLQKVIDNRIEILHNSLQTVEGTGSPSNNTKNKEESFTEYFATRKQFENSEMPKDSSGMNKEPQVLGFKELATVAVTCPDSLGTPCEGKLLILSKNPIRSGDQEFYLGFTMGTGYRYYGPFTDDLQRMVNESKAIKSLERSY